MNMNEIFKELMMNQNSWLIDIRSKAEWQRDCIPILMEEDSNNNNKNRVALISLYTSPNMELNRSFLQQLQEIVPNNSNGHYYFLCRSAHRSTEAIRLAQEIGYKECYGVAFHGTNGWIESGLPVANYTDEKEMKKSNSNNNGI